MGPFPPSNKFSYILVCIDYVSKWVEALPCTFAERKIFLLDTEFQKQSFQTEGAIFSTVYSII